MGSTWLDELNPPQRQAATHPGGPVLVIAGAGTGKTKTLACRVAWLIEQGVAPESILLLTFTRRASAEMLARAGHISGKGATGRVWGGTFHATANRLLRQYGRALGLSPEFTVMDQSDTADMMNLIRGDLGLGEGKRRFPQKATLASIYSRAVNSRTKVGAVVQKHFPWCQAELVGIREIFEAYTRRKREQQVLDYDDLLLYWNALMSTDAGKQAAGRFEHVLVDEYQDTNVIQAEILQGMRRDRREIMVVGDDAQSIYSFRAATIRNILDFPAQFPGTSIVKLEQNYRSVQPILDASNALMAGSAMGYAKTLFSARHGGGKPSIVTCQDEDEQCDTVCDRVLLKREEGIPLREQAVLFRAGHLSDSLEVELTRRNIPFVKYGGLKFVEAAHVKDMLAILRLLENPGDEMSWYRVLQLFDGVGPGAARRVIEALKAPDQAQDGPATPLGVLLHRPPQVPEPAAEDFASLRAAMADCLGVPLPETGAASARSGELSAAAQVERIRRFYEPVFTRVYDNPQVRLRDLDQLEQIAAGYTSRAQFLTDLTLDPPASTQDLAGPPLLDEDFLILSTIHSAKGCEWDVVHIIHVSDGVIPSDMATGSAEEIEEERRLLYVAMTRARDELNLYFPLRYYHRGRGFTDRHTYAQVTRFIPVADRHLYETVSVHTTPADETGSASAAVAAVNPVDEMLNDLWKE